MWVSNAAAGNKNGEIDGRDGLAKTGRVCLPKLRGAGWEELLKWMDEHVVIYGSVVRSLIGAFHLTRERERDDAVYCSGFKPVMRDSCC